MESEYRGELTLNLRIGETLDVPLKFSLVGPLDNLAIVGEEAVATIGPAKLTYAAGDGSHIELHPLPGFPEAEIK